MAEGVVVKPIPAITWADTNDREAALIQQCVAGDEQACAADCYGVWTTRLTPCARLTTLKLMSRPSRSCLIFK